MKLFFSLIFTLSLYFNINANSNYVFEKISPSSGFVFDAIHTISEDANGLIWFGTIDGLFYYNSSEVKRVSFMTDSAIMTQPIDVKKILTDKQGRIWVCTEKGLYKFSPKINACIKIPLGQFFQNITVNVNDILQLTDNNFLLLINRRVFSFSAENLTLKALNIGSNLASAPVSFIGKGINNSLLAGTFNGKVFVSENINSNFNLLYSSNKITRISTICAHNGNYLIGFDGSGIDLITVKGEKLSSYSESGNSENTLPSDRVRQIIKRSNGDIWIGTYRGILVISGDKRTVIKSTDYNKLPHNSIYVLHPDSRDGVWLGTWAGGIVYYNDLNYRFKHIKKDAFDNNTETSNIVISCFQETFDNKILVGSDHAGLYYSNQNGRNIKSIPLKDNNNIVNRIKSIETGDGINFWIGTFDQGLWQFNINTKKLKQIHPSVLHSRVIFSSLKITGDFLWIATRPSALFKYNIVTGEIKRVSIVDPFLGEINFLGIWKLFKDSSNNLWATTDQGIYLKKHNSDMFTSSTANKQLGLNNYTIYTINEDKIGRIWLGTKANGLYIYMPETDSLFKYENPNLDANYDVYSITNDLNNDVWFATNKGLFRHSIESGETSKYDVSDGLHGNLYNPNAVFLNSKGILFFGTPYGFSVVDPQIIKENTIKPDVYISELNINNIPFSQTDGAKVDAQHLPSLRNLKLKHTDNSISISFIGNNYIKANKNKFKYRLLNYNDNWTETHQFKDVSFTKIPPGHYELQVIGLNNDNVSGDSVLKLGIEIIPPFWQRWYAYVVYLLFISLLLLLIIKEVSFRNKTKKEILSERYKNEANDLLHKEKLKFFTNISHELRTPLTLIISPLNNLVQKFQYDTATLDHLKIIRRNADRLQKLTNQILDFRLLEVGKLQVNSSKVDIVDLCRTVANYFEILIKEKQINFILKSNYKSHFVYADSDMIEKIIYNLVANAIKFSEEKGQIIISIWKGELKSSDYEGITHTGQKFIGDCLSIRVQDNGRGIAEQDLPKIFERFASGSGGSESGTGIGLHMCQEYARLNQSNIMVQSAPLKGTTFILNIPIVERLEYEKAKIIIQPQFDIDNTEDDTYNIAQNKQGKRSVVLIAEDNDELRIYLKNFLSSNFKVLTAKNGKQAIEIAIEIIPDIVITDIMMPGIDGIELTKTLKSNQKTKHIPIIVLTALSENSYQQKSLLEGADAFLTKPIDTKSLLYQIDNVLNTRKILKEKYEQSTENMGSLLQGGKLSILERAEMIIEKNIQNPQFDIEFLASELNLSKSTLHRKIKSNANQSISEFIRDIRLKNAIKLLKDKKYNMDEIGYFVGFNSTSYFMRSFKKKYGQTPKEYSRNL